MTRLISLDGIRYDQLTVYQILASQMPLGKVAAMTSDEIKEYMEQAFSMDCPRMVLRKNNEAPEPVADSIYNVKQRINADASNPLVVEEQKLIPSVTRVFSKSRDLYVFLQAYERDATSTRPLVAFATFYQGQVKVFETAPLAVTQGLDAKSKAVPL